MCSTASRVAVNATDALSRCDPLPHTLAQLRPVVQGARPCEQDIANERAVLVHTTVGNVKLSFPSMSEWVRVSTDLWENQCRLLRKFCPSAGRGTRPWTTATPSWRGLSLL
ncbi:hypothetical protein ERJ75_001697500 [Trypanosoma vivax]|nr:hypothetical protein ERJ75_001697500 [Trypanosoma vivax]